MTYERFTDPERFNTNANFLAQRADMDLSLPPELASHPEILRATTDTIELLGAVDQAHGRGGVDFEVSRETGQLAPYHNGQHSRDVITDTVEHLTMTGNKNPEDYALAMTAAAWHDIIQSAGRGKNEEVSAQLAVQELLRRGYSHSAAQRAGQAILGTTLITDQAHQKAYGTTDPVVAAVAVGDLAKLARADGPRAAFDWFLELHAHMLSQTKQTHRQAALALDTPEGRQALTAYMAEQANFYRNFRYPRLAGNDVDRYYGRRQSNAQLQEALHQRLRDGRMGVLDVFDYVTELCA
jgi:hypothetical protein